MTKHREIRWQVFNDYVTEQGDNCVEGYPILFGSKEDADKRMVELQAGCDPSWFNPETGFLYVDQITL